MNPKSKNIIVYASLVIIGLTVLIWGIIKAYDFLMPITVACLLSMIMLPVCRWFEQKGMSRGWASFLSDLIIVLFLVIIIGILAAQITALSDDWPGITKKVQPHIEQLKTFIADKTGYSFDEQEEQFKQAIEETVKGEGDTQNSEQSNAMNQNSDSSGQAKSAVLSYLNDIVRGLFSSATTLLLILIYVFFFLLYRSKFNQFILRLIPDDRKEKANKILSESTDVSQNYLFGRMLLIIFLAVIYAIGLILSGVNNAILIALLAALLTFLPYIGNIVGYAMAIVMAFLSGSGIAGVIGVTITFTLAQFVESYILEPYIVGEQVNLNPIATIIVVVFGGALWGIVGMLISIPFLGILKVVFDNIPELNAFAYILGNDPEGDQNNIFIRVEKWAQNLFKGG